MSTPRRAAPITGLCGSNSASRGRGRAGPAAWGSPTRQHAGLSNFGLPVLRASAYQSRQNCDNWTGWGREQDALHRRDGYLGRRGLGLAIRRGRQDGAAGGRSGPVPRRTRPGGVSRRARRGDIGLAVAPTRRTALGRDVAGPGCGRRPGAAVAPGARPPPRHDQATANGGTPAGVTPPRSRLAAPWRRSCRPPHRSSCGSSGRSRTAACPGDAHGSGRPPRRHAACCG